MTDGGDDLETYLARCEAHEQARREREQARDAEQEAYYMRQIQRARETEDSLRAKLSASDAAAASAYAIAADERAQRELLEAEVARLRQEVGDVRFLDKWAREDFARRTWVQYPQDEQEHSLVSLREVRNVVHAAIGTGEAAARRAAVEYLKAKEK